MMRAKVSADLSGEQPRMDEVHPNIFIGNKFAAEDAHYLALNNISHVLNMADTVGLTRIVNRSSRSFVLGLLGLCLTSQGSLISIQH